VRLTLPGELAKHAVSEGTKAVTKFTSAWVPGNLLSNGVFLTPPFPWNLPSPTFYVRFWVIKRFVVHSWFMTRFDYFS
jgi:hypothetical protein